MRKSKFTNEFNRKYPFLTGKKLKELQKAFRVTAKDINTVFERGVGAYHNNPSSVRPGVDSSVQWSYARVYKFLLNVVKYRKGEIDKIPKSAGSDWKYVKSSGEFSDYIPNEKQS